MSERKKDKDLRFCRSLARFRATNRGPAWQYLVDLGKVTEDQAAALRRQARRDPEGYRQAMIDLAGDCLVLEQLREYLPFNPALGKTTNVGLLNMPVMIAENIYSAKEEGRWKALEKLPRKATERTARAAPKAASKSRRKGGEKAAAAVR